MSDSSSSANGASSGQPYPYRFGEVGVMMGVLKREQVRSALDRQAQQRQTGHAAQIGQVLVELGILNQRQVVAVLVAQKRLRTEQGLPQDAVAAADPPPLAPRTSERKSRSGTSTAKHPPVGARVEETAQPARRSSSRRAASPAPAEASPAAAPAAKSKRQTLGSFELIRQLGEGSMGAVFEAQDQEQNRRVALKVLPKNLASDAEFLARFKREVKTLSALNHPNIVAYLGAGQTGGYSYLSMEFVDGKSLSQRLKREKRIPEADALHICKEMAQALAYAHNLSLIHRDIKPENVLLTSDGRVKLIDFGLGKSQEDTSKLTAVGMSIGTPHYLSPEQALGKEHIDHRADLYSVGATLFQMLTGQVPFDHASSTQVMVMHVKQPPPDPRSLVPGISRGAAQLTLKLLAKEPEQRYASADELIAALERVMAGKPPDAAPTREVGGTGKKLPRTGGLLSRVKRGPKGCLSVLFLMVGAVAFATWLHRFL
ncbi:MAG: hypothetical protein AMXMBFR7_44500 [Planctomycetota bacterium]